MERHHLAASERKSEPREIVMTKQEKADKVFSEWVRQRDANDQGFIKCYCGAYVHWKDADASHFVSRQHLHTRYDERNVHASCRKCNRFLEGNKEDYSLFLIKKYGPEIFKELNENKRKPYWDFPYEKIIEKYKT